MRYRRFRRGFAGQRIGLGRRELGVGGHDAAKTREKRWVIG
jgi:hypothetical protein